MRSTAPDPVPNEPDATTSDRSPDRRALLAAGFAAALASPALAQAPSPSPAPAGGASAAPELRWQLGSPFARGSDILFGASETFARLVGEATDGRFQIQPAPVGEASAADRLIEDVGVGKIEMGHGASFSGTVKDPVMALASAMPFGMNARGQNAWWLQGGGGELFAEIFAKKGLQALPGGNTGAQMGGWFRKEIKTVADLQGLKLRIAGLGAPILQKLGVVPQNTAGPDLVSALDSKTIDAAEWAGPYEDEKLGLQKAAPIYHFPGFWEGNSALFFWINAEKWKGLPKTYQAVLRGAAAQVNSEVIARFDARNPSALRRLVSGGAQLKPFPQEVMEAALKAANDYYAELSAKDGEFKRVYDALKTFRNDEYLWFQVAEYTYDNFLIRARARG